MELTDENLAGKIFNRWEIIGFHEKRKYCKYFWCRCLDCGQIKSVYISNIIRGVSKSCGCKSRKEATIKAVKKQNEIIIDGNIAYIKVTTPIEAIMLFDTEDLSKLENLYIRGELKHNNLYPIATKDKKTLSICRYILDVNDSKLQVDHKNGNTLDNRKKNLRICTNQENNHNKIKPNKNNKGVYRGVSYDKNRNKWFGSIEHNGKHYRKRFETPELAYEWYINMNKNLYGDFSGFNRNEILEIRKEE